MRGGKLADFHNTFLLALAYCCMKWASEGCEEEANTFNDMVVRMECSTVLSMTRNNICDKCMRGVQQSGLPLV